MPLYISGPGLGNTLATTTPFDRAITDVARRMGYTGATPGFYVVDTWVGAVGLLRNLFGTNVPGRVVDPVDVVGLWQRFKEGACGTGTPGSTDVVNAINMIATLGTLVFTAAGISEERAREVTGPISTVKAIFNNTSRLVAETRFNLCPPPVEGPPPVEDSGRRRALLYPGIYRRFFGQENNILQPKPSMSTAAKVGIMLGIGAAAGLLFAAIRR